MKLDILSIAGATQRGRIDRVSASLAGRFKQKPHTLLGLIDRALDQACRRHVLVFVTELMGFAHESHERFIIVTQFVEHCLGRHKRITVVGKALEGRDLTHRAQRFAAELARPPSDGIDHHKNQGRLVVEQQMIVPEMRSTHVPVKILGVDK